MGDFLSTPNKYKHSSEGSNRKVQYGASSMQGWRRHNEDAHVTVLDFEPGHSLFAVFDGHGGAEVAKFCKAHILEELRFDPDFTKKNYEAALRNVLLKIDKMLLTVEGKRELKKYALPNQGPGMQCQAGCTANVILMTETHIYCANAGDARGVLCEKGKAIDLSKDHKPDLPSERSRVVAAGHYVAEGRVDGVIAISRAIGDWEYKNQKLPPEKMAVSAYADVSKTPITPDSQFFICACDGIWDCMTSQQACDFVNRSKLKIENKLNGTDLKLTKQTSSGSSGGKTVGRAGAAGVGVRKKPTGPLKGAATLREQKMDVVMSQSKFKGLATVIEMMMETNCPISLHQNDGLGTDNMTCIIVQFNKPTSQVEESKE